MAKKVTVIKAAKAQKHTQEERRLKVCGYARVSTGSQAQATSYTAQVEYYTEKIESRSFLLFFLSIHSATPTFFFFIIKWLAWSFSFLSCKNSS